MENYHVVFDKDSWQIKGAEKTLLFDTKRDAVEVAKRIAQEKNRSVIIHTQDGRISSVVSNGGNFAKGHKIQSANVKRRLENKSVRNSIAYAMSERILNN